MSFRLKRIVPMLMATVCFVLCASYVNPSEADSPGHYRFGHVQNICGPTDGPAFMLYFTANPIGCVPIKPPFVAITINEAVPTSPSKDYSITKGGRLVSGTLCLPSGICKTAVSGVVHLTKIRDKKNIVGDYELHFPNGAIEKTSFDASWCITKVVCG